MSSWRFVILLLAANVVLAPAVAADTHLLVVTGLGGSEEHRDRFVKWGADLHDAAVAAGLDEGQIAFLAEDVSLDPERIDQRSTKENVEAELARLAAGTTAEDAVWVVLIGHGSANQRGTRFNVPGPDLEPIHFATAFDAMQARVSFVNTAPTSGGFVAPLAGENRVIVAATRSISEGNETVFPGFFSAAFASGDADRNKDDRISVLEAFEYTRQEVERHYERGGLLRTEHAVLEDNGDGVGSVEPSALDAEKDGSLADRTFLFGVTVAQGAAGGDLYQQKAALEERIALLRQQKDSLDPALYEEELEGLLIELALKDREIRALESSADAPTGDPP